MKIMHTSSLLDAVEPVFDIALAGLVVIEKDVDSDFRLNIMSRCYVVITLRPEAHGL